MKKEDLNKIALEVIRINGTNNWKKLINVCKLMHINLSPVYIYSTKKYKCRFYLNNFYFPYEGVGNTQTEANCNAVEKFLNSYINISRVLSTNDCLMHNQDIRFEVKEEVKEIPTNINQNHDLLKESKLVKLADLILSKFTKDVWKVLNECCKSEKINFNFKYTSSDDQLFCSFLFDGFRFEQNVNSKCRIDSARKLSQAFVKKYASNYDNYFKKIELLLTLIAIECQQKKRNEITKILPKICQDLNIEFHKQFVPSINSFDIYLNDKLYQVTGVGVNENEAFISAIENLFVKHFSSEIFGKIQYWKIFNKIAIFSSENKFHDEWKSLCNSCKLLGFKYHECFTKNDSSFSVSFFIENTNCGLIGTGSSRNEAGICLGNLFVNQYIDLKKFYLENTDNLDDEEFIIFVINLCVHEFWSDNWIVLSNVCSKFNITLLKHTQREDFNEFQCAMSLGIHRYEKSITMRNPDLAFNLLAQHFFSKYGDRKLSENDAMEILKEINSANSKISMIDVSPISKDVSISNARLKIFHSIAAFCISNPKSDDWKTLCHACKSLKYKIYERFINRDSQFLCEIYINDESINITEMSRIRKEAANSVAKRFIKEYQQFDNDEDAVIYRNIAGLCRQYSYKDDWKALCKSCSIFNLTLQETFTKEINQILCSLSIENKVINFPGRGKTEKNAAIDAARKFIKKYNVPKTTNMEQTVSQRSNQKVSENVDCETNLDVPKILNKETYGGVYFLTY